MVLVSGVPGAFLGFQLSDSMESTESSSDKLVEKVCRVFPVK